MNLFHRSVAVVLYFFTPSFWRYVFRGQVRIAVYLSGGQVVKFNCVTFNFKMEGSGKEWTAEGLSNSLFFDPEAIVGMKEISWW